MICVLIAPRWPAVRLCLWSANLRRIFLWAYPGQSAALLAHWFVHKVVTHLASDFFNMKSGVAGVRCDRFEDDADVLRQRLVQALVPTEVQDAHKNDGQPNPFPEMAWRKTPSTGAPHLLDVAQLNLAQRVLVQLNAVGLIAGDSSVQVCELDVKHVQELCASNMYI